MQTRLESYIEDMIVCEVSCMTLNTHNLIHSLTSGLTKTKGQGCCLIDARMPEATTICSRELQLFLTRRLHGCLKLKILMAIAFMPTSNEGTTEFPAHFTLLKQKHKTCVHPP